MHRSNMHSYDELFALTVAAACRCNQTLSQLQSSESSAHAKADDGVLGQQSWLKQMATCSRSLQQRPVSHLGSSMPNVCTADHTYTRAAATAYAHSRVALTR